MEIISLIPDNIEWKEHPSFTLLQETNFTKEIRIVMKKSQEIKKHQAALPITIHLIKGSIVFDVEPHRFYLTEGDLITLAPKTDHYLLAQEDSLIRLTVLKTN